MSRGFKSNLRRTSVMLLRDFVQSSLGVASEQQASKTMFHCKFVDYITEPRNCWSNEFTSETVGPPTQDSADTVSMQDQKAYLVPSALLVYKSLIVK